jgi:hypothetical protein
VYPMILGKFIYCSGPVTHGIDVPPDSRFLTTSRERAGAWDLRISYNQTTVRGCLTERGGYGFGYIDPCAGYSDPTRACYWRYHRRLRLRDVKKMQVKCSAVAPEGTSRRRCGVE